jgi:hypothetical protein
LKQLGKAKQPAARAGAKPKKKGKR